MMGSEYLLSFPRRGRLQQLLGVSVNHKTALLSGCSTRDNISLYCRPWYVGVSGGGKERSRRGNLASVRLLVRHEKTAASATSSEATWGKTGEFQAVSMNVRADTDCGRRGRAVCFQEDSIPHGTGSEGPITSTEGGGFLTLAPDKGWCVQVTGAKEKSGKGEKKKAVMGIFETRCSPL